MEPDSCHQLAWWDFWTSEFYPKFIIPIRDDLLLPKGLGYRFVGKFGENFTISNNKIFVSSSHSYLYNSIIDREVNIYDFTGKEIDNFYCGENIFVYKNKLVGFTDQTIASYQFPCVLTVYDLETKKYKNIEFYDEWISDVNFTGNRIFVGKWDGKLICFDLNGEKIWEKKITNTGIKISNFDDELYIVGTNYGEVILIDKNGKQIWKKDINED
jgi:outer membrane protein assembly factor BamB